MVFKAVSADEGSLASCEPEPPVRFEPRTHKLPGWIADFPSQVPRRLLKYPELVVTAGGWCRSGAPCT